MASITRYKKRRVLIISKRVDRVRQLLWKMGCLHGLDKTSKGGDSKVRLWRK